MKIEDLKLMNIQVKNEGNVVYQGKSEDAPEEIKQSHYKTATFDSEYVILEI